MSRQSAIVTLTVLFSILCGLNRAQGTTRFVKEGASGSGASWADASGDLLAMINASSGLGTDEVWVAAGTYNPGTARTDTFSLKSGVQVFGGFDGTETMLGQRDVEGNLTILSGEIGDTQDPTDNSYHVVTANAVSAQPETRLDGFTIRDGFDDSTGSGAGIRVSGSASSPRIANCTIENNTAATLNGGQGGGVYSNSLDGQPQFENCLFRDNQARIRGAGLYIERAILLTMTGCVFENNSTTANGSPAPGGGALYVWATTNETRVTDCQFIGNTSAATTAAGGGGALVSRSVLELRGCLFDDNTATFSAGGALYADSGATTTIVDCTFTNNGCATNGGGAALGGGNFHIVNCTFLNNTAELNAGGVNFVKPDDFATMTTCLFAGNSATTGNGGAMEGVAGAAFDTPLIATNLTVVNNHADLRFGGISIQRSDGIFVANSVLWENTDSDNVDAQIGTTDPNAPGPIDVSYSDIQDEYQGTGNISDDPLFVDAASNNYRLQPCSPASDAANFDVIPADSQDVNDDMNTAEATPDLDKLARAFNNPNRSNDGVGANAFTDMGAYEINVPECTLPGDLLVDSAVDGLDIAPFIGCVLDGSPDCPCADLDLSGLADIGDVGCFVNLLLTGMGCEVSCTGGLRGFPDCNTNGIPDAGDINGGASADCNDNGIPDECDVDPSDPDGDLLVSDDVNSNGIPDECEVDCNGNGTPDDFDISSQTSGDVNGNGVPDECEIDCNSNGTPDDWDIAQATSADCNTNGSPDECEQDCNSNGVPDDCDVDPTDPDGDTFVSPDCNANGNPDECDIALPPGFGSLDCNTNGTPDECDIASCESDPACDDCNANGIPDGCDIAAQISEDTNSNGIPDECEGQQAQGGDGEVLSEDTGESPVPQESTGGTPAPQESTGGGDETTGGTPMLPDDDAAWDAFWEWSCDITQGANPSLAADQKFAAMVAKLQELGLPLINPAIAALSP
jgi:hypothetical protein